MRARALRTALFAGLLLSACSRAVSVNSGPAPTYPISVENAVGRNVIVAYDDGRGARTLGTVQAGRTERFLIASPAVLTVSITARSEGGDRTWGPFPLNLEAGVTRSVTIR